MKDAQDFEAVGCDPKEDQQVAKTVYRADPDIEQIGSPETVEGDRSRRAFDAADSALERE